MAGLIERAAALMPPFQSLLVVICYVMGIVFAINSLRGFAAVGDRSLSPRGWSQAGWQGPTCLMVLAVSFVSLSSVISMFLVSLWSQPETAAATEVFAYAPELLEPLSNEMGTRVVIAVVRIIQFIGLVSFVRGLYFANLASLHANSGYLSRGITHMVGGVFAMNLVMFLQQLQDFVFGN